VRRLDELLALPVGTRSIAVVRFVAGLVAFAQLRPVAVSGLRGDTFHDRFHEPFLDPIFDVVPMFGPAAYTALVATGAVAGLAMSLGAATKVASILTTTAVGYHLLVSTTHLHNNRAYLFAVLVGVSLAPAGRSLSVDRWWRGRRGLVPFPEVMPGWPLWLLRFECSLVYGASGFSKLIDPDWFGGTVTWGRVVTQEALLRASVLPDFAQDLLLDRSFHTIAAKVVVLTELFIAGGFWWRRTRPWAVATAVGFHVVIEASASVQTFSYLALGVLFVWADPDLARLIRRADGRLDRRRFRRVAV
jgi:vitamin K-dependent gamma-carboxylase